MRRLTFPPRTPEVLLASWFVVISVMRVSVISAAAPGFDAKLYRTATLTWLQGGDPWSVYSGAIRFAAPPPSLLAMLPFALVPETVAVVAITDPNIAEEVQRAARCAALLLEAS